MEGDARERILEHLGVEGRGEAEIESSRPRILLAARDFPQELTSSVLWLNDAGLDIRCVRLLPYRVGHDLVLDVTQVIPLPEAQDYTVRIRGREAEQDRRTYQDLDWTREEIERLASLITSPFNLRLLDICAERPGEWVSLSDVREAGSAEEQARWPQARFGAGALGGLTQRVRREFGRGNWPMEYEYVTGGDSRRYRFSRDVALWWSAARQASRTAAGDS